MWPFQRSHVSWEVRWEWEDGLAADPQETFEVLRKDNVLRQNWEPPDSWAPRAVPGLVATCWLTQPFPCYSASCGGCLTPTMQGGSTVNVAEFLPEALWKPVFPFAPGDHFRFCFAQLSSDLKISTFGAALKSLFRWGVRASLRSFGVQKQKPAWDIQASLLFHYYLI